jgi:hypothetical protein
MKMEDKIIYWLMKVPNWVVYLTLLIVTALIWGNIL